MIGLEAMIGDQVQLVLTGIGASSLQVDMASIAVPVSFFHPFRMTWPWSTTARSGMWASLLRW